MTRKTAAELSVGDVFCREGSQAQYRVRGVQSVPVYGFYGNLFDTIQITVDHHLTGRVTNINLSPEEEVVLVPPAEVLAPRPTSSPSRWGRRRRAF